MLQLERDGFSRQEIIDAIHAKYSARNIRFKYNLLDKYENFIRVLDNVVGGEVSMSSLDTIKRKARFELVDEGQAINYLSDRIQPIMELKVKQKWVQFPLGIFLLNSPKRSDKDGIVYRDIEAFDGTIVLRDDKFESRYTILAGTNYRTAVIDILLSAGITKHNIEQTDKVVTNDIEFEPGKEKIYAINELLRHVNFNQIIVDVNGYYLSKPYVSPSARASEYTYKDDKLSIIYADMEEELDLFDTFNKWVVILSNPEKEALVAAYTNDNPESPMSTVNRGRTIVDYREVDNVADQESLNAYVQRIAFENSQIFGRLEFETAINPAHDYNDVLQIEYSPLNISDKYSEVGWSMRLESGARMKHQLRKVVQI